MCENFPNIRVTEGNAFALLLPLRKRTYVASQPIDEDIDPTQLQNIVVTFGGVEYAAEATERGVQIVLPETLAIGTYDVLLTAQYLGSEIRAAYESAVTIVAWSAQSTAEQYIAGSPYVLRAAYVLSGALTDAELEELKEEYREKNAQLDQAIADAEAAKAEWEQKAADLDGVAQESTSQEILTAVENIDFSEVAKQGTNPNANISDIQVEIDAISPDIILGKQQLAAAITDKGVTTASTDPLSTMAGNVQAIQNVTKEFEEVDFIEKWQGQSMINGLNIIHQYYNMSLPTSQCYVVVDGAILSIPVGASRLIYYNNGTLTTIDNPSGDYMIGAVPNNVIGFALLQYAGRTINNLPLATTDKVYSISVYDADITFQSLASTSVSMIQLEDCEVSFAANSFQYSALGTFVLYGTSTIKNGIISNPYVFGSCADLEYISLPTLATISGTNLFYGCVNLEHIHLPNLSEILSTGTFSGLTRLYAIDLPNLQILNSGSTFQNDYNLRVINLPNLKTFSAAQCFYSCQSLVKLNMHNLESFNGSSAFTNCANLIHLDIGAGMNVSFNINSWSPTNALNSSSSSLVDPDETFANNLEKLLYNIREHIAANLPDRTGLSSLTLTMSAAVKAAILADQPTADSFTNKNWIIA